jgi:hypothetical protein
LNVAHAIASAGEGMQIHQDRLPRCLGISISHRYNRSFLQRQYKLKIWREIAEEGQLGRARIPEYRRQAELPHEFVCGFLDGKGIVLAHIGLLLTVFRQIRFVAVLAALGRH